MWQCAINVCHWPQSSCPGGSGGSQFSGLARAGLANRNEGLADRRRGLANRTEGLANRSESLGGRAGLGPVDKSEGLRGQAGPGPKHCKPIRWFATFSIAHCHVKLIADSTSEQCMAALQASAGQPGDLKDAAMEGLVGNEKVSAELKTALKQVLISTKDVPLTDGYKRSLRHEGHNLNVTEGALVVFATFNFADTYSPVLFRLVQEGLYPGSAAPPALEIKCTLTDDAPDLPSLQQMHQLIAESPRAQAKFFLLMDDIADVYFMGMDYSFVGRHHVQQSFHHKFREDTLASTGIPSLGGYGVAELEPFESQQRGFEHGHRKKYSIPKVREREVIEM